MKKIIAGGATAIALAVALPFGIAAADQHMGDRHSGKGGRMMMEHGGHGGHGRMGHHGGKMHGKRHDRMRAKIRLMKALERFDADNDGSITQEEVDEYRTDRLAEFDTDNDGALSLEEYEALWLDAMRKRMVRRFQHHDSDGDGKVTAEEFAEQTKYMVMKRDRNEDGVLNEDDLKRGKGGRGGRRGMMKDGEMHHGMRSKAQEAETSDKKSE